jgi:hypothetical protein
MWTRLYASLIFKLVRKQNNHVLWFLAMPLIWNWLITHHRVSAIPTSWRRFIVPTERNQRKLQEKTGEILRCYARKNITTCQQDVFATGL